jgi:hypothetical protein
MENSKKITKILLFALIFAQCKSETKAPSNTSATATAPSVSTTVAASERPEQFLYVVETDNLLLRDQPSQQSSKVITKFKVGTILTGAGIVSSNKETATIRGMELTEPFIQVSSISPEVQQGWAFGGALQAIYTGSKANSPDLVKLGQLATYLNTLNPKKQDSGKKAWDFVKSSFANANGSLADAALILLEKFMRRMELEGDYYTITEKMKWAETDYEDIANEKFDMNKYPQTKAFAENGLRLEVAEGMYFPISDFQNFSQFFGNKVTPAMKSWLSQSLLEQKDAMSSDGGIIIPLEQVADRAVFWSKFNTENPWFPYSAQTIESEKWLHLVLATGTNNSNVFGEEEKVTPEFTAMWKYILDKYPGTKAAQIAKDMTDLMAASQGKRNEAVNTYQEKLAQEYEK